ncbi:ER to Golgi transport-related protein [Kockovaella imperatae]|uniref:ER to Golgi transport-related protein n=1 Tax=Kockovaella imperatae TaxID=4999 RepID=A0A1Y1UKG0_9TREE|nr:ER to Golgi transport-related protein [Kockovaella imperatae]ORX38538.1 ER to Golgi transport-related protein [Kockovaella imperatae]
MSGRPSTSSTTHTQLVAPTVPAAVHALASPPPTLIDSQLPAYLVPEILRCLEESTLHVIRKRRREEDELRAEGLIPRDNGKGKAPEEEKRLLDVELAKKVERMGLMVGGYVAEKLTLARPPLPSHLDIIKFICKDLFLFVYAKQIDNLRTNHRGVFVLQSHAFPPLVPLSSHRGPAADLEAAKQASEIVTTAYLTLSQHLLFPQALIQGALARLGMPATVTAETSGLPQCTFQIRTVPKSAVTSSATTPAMPGSAQPS